ncbi:Ig-like domain-containing protein [Oceanirhabdus sp. W0125-5]|uniref:Ig-like domain-containing protein n=1 Tax=Oceanirhabdus sp. W0125-5 TaxID=2999116 RepID=UPI0022F2AF64|nr:Ig-like domain-containing protein [Oceanirhabdus sp. W0125-5]WBW96628.1 Ig-like domain-containing protein [Oceanirhabdus sp. W0125-5]
MAIENFSPGTLIIPMEEQFQDNGMWLAYGLVYRLLENGIPVKWAIQPGKLYDGTDFTASARDIQTLVPISNHDYIGGPYIVDSAYAAAALPIITAWQAAYPDTTVHEATNLFSAPIAGTMSRAPRISIDEKNPDNMIDYLNEANIPDSLGVPWDKNTSPGVLDSTEITNGGLFGFNEADPCKFLAYDIFLSSESDSGVWGLPSNIAQLDLYLRIGGFVHATESSIDAIENFAGPFITVAGIPDFPNQGDDNTFTVDVPDFPSAQAVSTSGKVQKLPAGSERTWLNTDVTYDFSAQVIAHFIENSLQYDFMAAGSYKGGTGAGKIVYEGGKDYDRKLPYSDNEEGPYLRFVYDSVFFSVLKPTLQLTITPNTAPTSATTTVTYDLNNIGGSNADNLTLTITLEAWNTYNNDANITPTSISTGPGGVTILTWDIASLVGNTGPGNIINFTADVTPPLTGKIISANYTASYQDDFYEYYSVDYCASIEGTPGAAPQITETPATQTVNPNDVFSWTITASNNGLLQLDNVQVTKTIPAELIFISSIPAPTTITGGGGLPTILTWTAPDIPDPLLPLSSFNIDVNVQAPPATTATFDNIARLTGTDTSPASYDVSTTAEVQVINRPPTVNVVTPNGGELICTQVDITWTASDPDGDPLTYSIQYSPDAGVTFIDIVSGLTTTSYTWVITSLPSGTDYLIKVIASDGELTGEDTSDGTFTIDTTPPAASWISPLTGDLLVTSPVYLQVQATDNVAVAQVTFQYSQDGITFTTIGVDNVPSGDVFTKNWETDGLLSGNYFLRAIAEDLCGRTDQQDIQVIVSSVPDVTIISPNGGEIFCNSPVDITWSISDPSALGIVYTVQYSDDNGTTFNTIATGITTTSYSWDTSSLLSGNEYLIKVIATDGITSKEDVSDGSFTIDNTGPIVTFIAPPDGSTIDTLSVILRVTAVDNVAIDNVLFQYSIDGITFVNIATETVPIGGFYETTWNLTGLTQGNYTLRATAEDICGKTSFDEIQVLFNIPPTVTITNPNGGELICPEGTTITWDAESIDGGVLTSNLFYSPDNGTTFILLASGLTTSSFFWDTSGLPSANQYLIKVIVSDGLSTAEDISDGSFTIDNEPPSVDIIEPADGALVSSSPVLIQATATDNIGVQRVTFQYSSNGVTFIDIGVDTLPVGNVYSGTWNLTGLIQGEYILRAIAEDICGQTNISDIDVTFNIPPSVTVLSPNGGEIIGPSGTTITWLGENPDGVPLIYSVSYSSDGGVSYNVLATGLNTTSFFWDTSGLPSGNDYLVKVIADDGIETAEDTSDSTFTIDNTPPEVLWISPLNGEYLSNTVSLTAMATDNIAVKSVTFSYSNDGGVTYTDIGTVLTPLDGVYVLPFNTALVSDGAYILKATAEDNFNLSSSEIINVIIDNTPPVVYIIYPVNGSTVDGLVPIIVSANDNICLSKIELSIDNEIVDIQTLNGETSSEIVFEWDTNTYSENTHVVKAVVTDCAGFITSTQSSYIVNNLPECYTQVFINGELKIPDEKPPMERILYLNINTTIDKIDRTSSYGGIKFIICGTVDISITYVAAVPEQEVHYAHFAQGLSTTIVCNNVSIDQCVEPVIFVEHVGWDMLDSRTFNKRIVLFIGLKPI